MEDLIFISHHIKSGLDLTPYPQKIGQINPYEQIDHPIKNSINFYG